MLGLGAGTDVGLGCITGRGAGVEGILGAVPLIGGVAGRVGKFIGGIPLACPPDGLGGVVVPACPD